MEYYLGIDLGGTSIKAGVVDGDFRIIGRAKEKTGIPRPAEEIMDAMAQCARKAAEDAGIAWADIRRIGVGVPGTANEETGVVEYANNLPFENVPMRAYLEKKLHKVIDITNDANAAALGEVLAGAAKGAVDAVVVTLGTGVGGGIVIGGKLFTGFHYGAAELGHMGIVLGGRPCTCGRRGCLEAYVSATGLIRSTKEAMDAHPDSRMWEVAAQNGGKVSGRTAFLAAGQGDAAGQAVVDAYIEQLGYGLASIANILAPQVLVIGGGVSNEGENLLRPLVACIRPQLYVRDPEKQARVVLATLGNDAGLIGAAFLGSARCD
ncbi:MAG: ROK family protein [Oscillospiraceae bacterium]|nr:ROK family protein [Oscillospiraceae bacterium]